MLSAASCKPLPPSVAAVNSNTTTSVTTVSSGSTTFGSTKCHSQAQGHVELGPDGEILIIYIIT